MSFKGEIGAEFLDNVKTGFTVGDIYRIIDAGKLGGVDIPFGTFVEWKGTTWEVKKDMQYATSKTGESLDQAVADVLDNHNSSDTTENFYVSNAEASNYKVGQYYEHDGDIWLCTNKVSSTGRYKITGSKQNGVIPILNNLLTNGIPYAYKNQSVTISSSSKTVTVEQHSVNKVSVTCNNGTTVRPLVVKAGADSYTYILKTGTGKSYVDLALQTHDGGVFNTVVHIYKHEYAFSSQKHEGIAPSQSSTLPTSWSEATLHEFVDDVLFTDTELHEVDNNIIVIRAVTNEMAFVIVP